MKTSLILPCAGLSTRFPGMPPKWRLRHPNGSLMVYEAVRSLSLEHVNSIYVTMLAQHLEDGLELNELRTALSPHPVYFYLLDEPTLSQPETVARTLQAWEIAGPIFVRDCDNQFDGVVYPGNYVYATDINQCVNIDPISKSYIKLSGGKEQVLQIREKVIISSLACCGGYGFFDAFYFLAYFQELKALGGDCYISHIIQRMLEDGHRFDPIIVQNFNDWGTAEQWERYCRQLRVLSR